MNRRGLVFWIGLAAILLVLAFLSSNQRQSGDPLDPDSTDPLGTRGLVLLLEEFGASVERRLPTESTEVVLVLADRFDDEQRRDVETWVENGGTLIVSDPGSPFVPSIDFPDVVGSGTLGSGVCTIEALTGLTIEASSFILYPSEGTSDRCFGDDGSYVHVEDLGRGRVISLGGALALTNQNLDEADNAVLATTLLLPQAETEVAVLFEPIFSAGSKTLSDLVPSAAKWAAWQGVVAFAIFVFWRGRRFGRPVPEPQPVELPGSLLVRASAELHRRSGGHGEASIRLRSHLDRRLRRHLKVAPELSPSELATAAVIESEAPAVSQTPDRPSSRPDRATIERALSGSQATTGRELATLVVDIDLVNTLLDEDDPASAERQSMGDQT